ncbi:MAG: hypothetical protein GX604_00460 [Actinobacteria bacterium]|nr:hypothetical protein [Actinomycetota bacterium]
MAGGGEASWKLGRLAAGELELSGRMLRLTNTDRVYFPAAGLTKGHLLHYYREVAPFFLPHLRNRPLSLERFPEGVDAPSFYQKNAPAFFPSWLRTFPIEYRRARKIDRHVLVDDAAGLVYLANLGTITFHTFLSRIDDLSHPDILIIDIDPPPADSHSLEEAFEAAAQTALLLKVELQLLGMKPHVKTSGKRGIHLGLPLDGNLTYEELRHSLAQLFARLTETHPDLATRAMRKERRQGRVYLDAQRMALGATVVPPYTVRPTPTATISMPVTWDELETLPHGQTFTMANTLERLATVGDLWAAVITGYTRSR